MSTRSPNATPPFLGSPIDPLPPFRLSRPAHALSSARTAPWWLRMPPLAASPRLQQPGDQESEDGSDAESDPDRHGCGSTGALASPAARADVGATTNEKTSKAATSE